VCVLGGRGKDKCSQGAPSRCSRDRSLHSGHLRHEYGTKKLRSQLPRASRGKQGTRTFRISCPSLPWPCPDGSAIPQKSNQTARPVPPTQPEPMRVQPKRLCQHLQLSAPRAYPCAVISPPALRREPARGENDLPCEHLVGILEPAPVAFPPGLHESIPLAPPVLLPVCHAIRMRTTAIPAPRGLPRSFDICNDGLGTSRPYPTDNAFLHVHLSALCSHIPLEPAGATGGP